MYTRLFSLMLFLFSQIIYSQVVSRLPYHVIKDFHLPRYGVKFEISINREVSDINFYEYDELIDVFIKDFEFYKNQFYMNILVPDDLKNQLEIFFENLKNNTIRTVDFELNEEGVLGVSKSIFDDSKITLSINPYLWETSSTPKKLYVIYHELGHDILNLRHGEGGKMMFTLSDDEYTLKQFYKDRGYMFMNFFKRFFNNLGYKEFVLNLIPEDTSRKGRVHAQIVRWDGREYVGRNKNKKFNANRIENELKIYLFGKPFSGKGVDKWKSNEVVRYFDNGIWRNKLYYIFYDGQLQYVSEPVTYNIDVHADNRYGTDHYYYDQWVKKNTYHHYKSNKVKKIDDVEHGKITTYNIDGGIEKIENYIKVRKKWGWGYERKKNGKQTLYYDNGTIETVGLYENGKLLEYSWYDVNGEEEEKITDVDENSQLDWERGFERKESEREYFQYPNLKIYRIKYYNKKGKIYRLQSIKNKKTHGDYIAYYESGNIEHKENYVDGLIQGEGIWYYESGSVQSNLNYLDGKLQGEQIMYYESGSVNFKTNYVDDKEQGDRIDYYESGKIKSKSKYVDGKRQGDIIEYYESGELINNN